MMSRQDQPAHSLTSVEPKTLRLWDRALIGALLLWTYLSLCYPVFDTDFWWHLKTGEWILENRTIPQVDLFTFTEVETPWIDLHWGFQLLITMLYHAGGFNLLILVKAAIITMAVAVACLAGGRGLPSWQRVAIWVLPVICISGRGYERPEMLSLLFLALWLSIARHVEKRPRLIWFLPLITVIWVNCHALFVLGLVVAACYVADCLARDLARGRWGLERPAREPSARSIIWAGALVAMACLANPYFDDGALFPLTLYRKFTVDQEFYSVNVGEFHRPIDFVLQFGWRGAKSPYLLAELGVWLMASTTFVWLLVVKRRWSVMRFMLFAGFSHLAWEATRNTNIFALVAGFVASENLREGLAFDREPLARNFDFRRFVNRARAMAALLLALIVAVVTGFWNEIGDLNKPFGLGEARNWFIHDAARFAGQPGFPRLAFIAHNGQAAVYIYHNAPERRVFMDGRLEVCSRRTFETYNQILTDMATGAPRWKDVLGLYSNEMPVVIFENSSLLQIRGLLLTPGWRLVFADRTATVFLSNAQADSLLLPAASLPPALEQNLREVERRIQAIRSGGR
jgi:hypothetical protein